MCKTKSVVFFKQNNDIELKLSSLWAIVYGLSKFIEHRKILHNDKAALVMHWRTISQFTFRFPMNVSSFLQQKCSYLITFNRMSDSKSEFRTFLRKLRYYQFCKTLMYSEVQKLSKWWFLKASEVFATSRKFLNRG